MSVEVHPLVQSHMEGKSLDESLNLLKIESPPEDISESETTLHHVVQSMGFKKSGKTSDLGIHYALPNTKDEIHVGEGNKWHFKGDLNTLHRALSKLSKASPHSVKARGEKT